MTSNISQSDPHVAEAVANAVTHGIGFLASVLALPVLIIAAAATRDALQVTGAAVYGTSLIILYGASTLYHSFAASPARTILRTIDHSAIYVLIAGSYTPFALGPLRGTFGYSLLVAVWSMAFAGIALKATRGFGKPWLTIAPYIVMGWIAVLGIRPLWIHVGPAGLAWLLAGGIFYTGGVVFYANDHRMPYGHAMWHLCVLAGSVCHFLAVLWHSGARPT
jgi:hemolysin III